MTDKRKQQQSESYQPFNARVMWTVYAVVVTFAFAGMIVLLAFFTRWSYPPTGVVQGAVYPTSTPVPTIMQVVAFQPIPAGVVVPAQAVALRAVELRRASPNGYSDVADVVGKTTTQHIGREWIVTDALLVDGPPPDDPRATATAAARTATPKPSVALGAALPTATPAEVVTLLVANRLIPAGSIITPGDFSASNVMVDTTPFNAVLSMSNSVLVGKVLVVDLPADAPVLSNMLVDPADPPDWYADYTPPTPPPGACVLSTTSAGSININEDPQRRFEIGYLRDGTDYVVTEVRGTSYHVTLPSGAGIGWVRGDEALLSGDGCDDLLD